MQSNPERQSLLFGRWLYFFAAYTLLIKYILPISWAALRHEPLTTYIFFWDLWWLFHLIVGFHLIRRKKKTWFFAVFLAIAEILIISTKFFFYFHQPNLDFWHVNWFVNKTALLIYFIVLFIWLCRKEVREML